MTAPFRHDIDDDASTGAIHRGGAVLQNFNGFDGADSDRVWAVEIAYADGWFFLSL